MIICVSTLKAALRVIAGKDTLKIPITLGDVWVCHAFVCSLNLIDDACLFH